MHEPYSDNPEKGKGILICEEAELMEIVKKVSSSLLFGSRDELMS